MIVPNHPYLRKKKCSMCGTLGIRVSDSGALVIPVFRKGRLISIQKISDTGEKRFATGAPTRGGYFEITRPRACVTILCEGAATGLVIFEAMPNAKVFVCFSAENLVRVAEENEWSGFVTIAADNDISTEENTGKNPGVECAQRAAKIIGCGVAIPQPERGTDWNDVACEQIERLEKLANRFTSPHKLRASALSFIAPAMMRNAKMVSEK